MPALTEWKVPTSAQPRAEDYGYDLERALSSVVGLHSIIPPDGFTAETLGVERAGNGVLIDDGLVLTIGYLITEAQTVWLHRDVPRDSAFTVVIRPTREWCTAPTVAKSRTPTPRGWAGLRACRYRTPTRPALVRPSRPPLPPLRPK